jgi:hypothetical protein
MQGKSQRLGGGLQDMVAVLAGQNALVQAQLPGGGEGAAKLQPQPRAEAFGAHIAGKAGGSEIRPAAQVKGSQHQRIVHRDERIAKPDDAGRAVG